MSVIFWVAVAALYFVPLAYAVRTVRSANREISTLLAS